MAKVCLETGAEMYGCSRRRPDDLAEAGLRFQALDLANATEAAPAFEKWIADAGDFDLVVLNAGKLGSIRDMRDTPLEDLRETMEINVWANKWILDALFRGERAVRQVIAISSGASQSGSRGWNGYSLSKATLNMLVRLYAGEQTDTHFTALAPGLVDTAMQDYLTSLPSDPRYTPLERLKAAKGTDAMPDAESCARQLVPRFPELLREESGAYVDIRDL